MVVDQPASLHESIDDGRADEAKAALAQRLAERVRLRRARGDIGHRARPVYQRLAPDEAPGVGVERPSLMLYQQHRARLFDRRANPEPVAHDGLVAEQTPPLRRAQTG